MHQTSPSVEGPPARSVETHLVVRFKLRHILASGAIQPEVNDANGHSLHCCRRNQEQDAQHVKAVNCGGECCPYGLRVLPSQFADGLLLDLQPCGVVARIDSLEAS